MKKLITLVLALVGVLALVSCSSNPTPANMQDVFNTMNATIGTYYVNDFSMLGKNFQVNIRAKGDT